MLRVISSNINAGVPVVAQWLTNPTRNHEVAGSVPALAQWVNNQALPIGPLAREPPYAVGAAQEIATTTTTTTTTTTK